MSYFCQTCGKPFKGESWRPNHFCSHRCVNISRSEFHKSSAPDVHLTEQQAQYIAGFLDAEGTIWSGSQHKTKLVHVQIPNTNYSVLETIREWTAYGKIYTRMHFKGHFGNKTIYVWVSQSRYFSEKFLVRLFPYLRVKRRAAEEAVGCKAEIYPMSFGYVAGFFDGEGSCRPATEYNIAISNEVESVLEEIQSFLGYGHIYKRKGEDMYDLKVYSHKDRLKFVESVLPFSIVKRAELLEAQQFIQNKDWDMDEKGGHKLAHVTDEELRGFYLNQKLSVRDLAAKYGVKYNPMYQHLKKIGVQFRPLGTNQTFQTPSPLARANELEVIEKYQKGNSESGKD